MRHDIRNVVVLGAGIGGLAVAITLALRGITVDVLERQTGSLTKGVGIIQPPNALRALSTMGVLEQCFEAGFQSDERRAFDSDGNLLGVGTATRLADPIRGAVNFIRRPALHAILLDRARELGVTITQGVTVDSFVQDDRSVQLTLSDGTSRECDLFIGADGIRSWVRDQIFGESVKPIFTGHGVWRYTTRRPPEVTYSSLFYGVGVKAGLMPLSEDMMYLLLVTNEPTNPWMPHEQLPELLRSRLAPFNGLVGKVRESIADDDEVIYAPIEEVILHGPWHKGRVLLIGDAAHASSPHLAQGAAMAIEDAVVLAEMIETDDVDDMLHRFSARRAPRCRYVQDSSHAAGDIGQLTDPAECARRNEALRISLARPTDDFLANPI